MKQPLILPCLIALGCTPHARPESATSLAPATSAPTTSAPVQADAPASPGFAPENASGDGQEPPFKITHYDCLEDAAHAYPFHLTQLDAEFVAIRTAAPAQGMVGEDGRPFVSFNTFLARGTACNAADSACPANIQQLERELALQACDARSIALCPTLAYAVVVRNGKVELWNDQRFKQLLGAIDSPIEAFLWTVATQGVDSVYSCAHPEYYETKTLADGYELRLRKVTSVCRPVVLTEFTYHIAHEGKVTVVKNKVVKRDDKACPQY